MASMEIMAFVVVSVAAFLWGYLAGHEAAWTDRIYSRPKKRNPFSNKKGW